LSAENECEFEKHGAGLQLTPEYIYEKGIALAWGNVRLLVLAGVFGTLLVPTGWNV